MFGSSKKEEQSVLLCTIESGAVHATLCLMHPKSKPFIVHSVTKPIPLQETFDFERFAGATLQSLADACQDVITKGVPHVSSRRIRRGHIDAAYCTYGAPWYVSQTKTVDVKLPGTTVVTKSMFQRLLAEHSGPELSLSLADQNDAPRVLEQNIINIRLNGYPVGDPYDKEASRVSFSVLVGGVSRAFSEYVEDVVGRFFACDRIHHHAGSATLYFGVRDTLASSDSFLCIDVSGEITDISAVSDGVLFETVSFPLGVRTAMRSFAASAKVLPSEVLGIMQGLKDKTLDEKVAAAYEKAAEKVRNEWQSAFSQAMLPLLEHLPLPKSAFLFGDSGEFARVKDVLVPTKLSHPQTGDSIATTLVLAESLSSFCVVREGVRLGHPLTPLSALHVHRLLTMKNGGTL